MPAPRWPFPVLQNTIVPYKTPFEIYGSIRLPAVVFQLQDISSGRKTPPPLGESYTGQVDRFNLQLVEGFREWVKEEFFVFYFPYRASFTACRGKEQPRRTPRLSTR